MSAPPHIKGAAGHADWRRLWHLKASTDAGRGGAMERLKVSWEARRPQEPIAFNTAEQHAHLKASTHHFILPYYASFVVHPTVLSGVLNLVMDRAPVSVYSGRG